MQLIAQLYRVATIPTEHLISVAGFSGKVKLVGDSPASGEYAFVLEDGTRLSPKRVDDEIRKKFAPLAPRFKIFYSEMHVTMTVIGIEAMYFNVHEAQKPQAGIVMFDPMDSHDVDKMDGALASELNRLGLSSNGDFEWRMAFETKGN